MIGVGFDYGGVDVVVFEGLVGLVSVGVSFD